MNKTLASLHMTIYNAVMLESSGGDELAVSSFVVECLLSATVWCIRVSSKVRV